MMKRLTHPNACSGEAHPQMTSTAASSGSYGATRLACFASDAGLLTKTLSRDADGTLAKRSAVYLSSGTVDNLALDSFDAFGEVLTGLRHDQALAYGVSLRGSGPIMSEKQWGANGSPAGVLLRDRDHFNWARAPGILMLDYDPPKDAGALTKEELLAVLYGVFPPLERAAHFWRPSAGSCIFDTDDGTEVVGVAGQRVYLWVDDAREIPRVGKLIEARLWLAQQGRIEVSRDGRLLERTVVDGSVWQPERLDFASGAKCAPPLEQRRPAPERLGGGAPLDTAAVPELSHLEQQAVDRAKIKAKAPRRDEATRLREQRITVHAQKIQKQRGLEGDAAVLVARDAYERQRLMGDFLLVSQDGIEVSVKDVLEDPSTWHGQRFHDPLDVDCDDERIAWVNLFSGGQPYLWSHAHGGSRYELCKALMTIQCSAGGMALATNQTLEVMRTSTVYYERANSVVAIAERGEVYPVGAYALKQRLEGEICFQKFDGRQKEVKRVDCPDEIARRVLDMRGDRGLPRLIGVQQYPTMTPDGRLLERPGYDAETGLFLVNPSDKPWPRIAARASDDDVVQALDRLWGPFALFPYVDDTSRGIALGALLTAVVRRTLPTAPAFMFQAPAAGSGKTLLASCVVELAGSTPLMSLPDRDEEIQKVLVSHLRKAPASLFFDNVVGVVDSKALNAMLTAETYEGRILGVSETSGALPTNVLVVLTGNNARPAGDTCRRMLVCTIDARMEDPYRRAFDFNPLDRVRGDRIGMVVAALTILSGAVAHTDRRLAPGSLGSFESWERLIRQAVVWVGQLERAAKGSSAAGFGDPIANIQAQYAEDDDTEALGALLGVWACVQDGTGFKADTLFKELDNARRMQAVGELAALGQALLNVMPKASSARGVSRWLRNAKGRIVRRLRLEGRHDALNNNTSWFVQHV